MVSIGFGMAAVNAGILFLSGGNIGTLFVSSLAAEPTEVVNALQILFLQPIYTLTFTNGMIASLIFLGIGP